MPFLSDKQRKWFFANNPEYSGNKRKLGSYHYEQYQPNSLTGKYRNRIYSPKPSYRSGLSGLPGLAQNTLAGGYAPVPSKLPYAANNRAYSSVPIFDKETEELFSRLTREQKLSLLQRIVEGQFFNEEYHAVSRRLAKVLAELVVPKNGTIKYRYLWVDRVSQQIEDTLKEYAPERLPERIARNLWQTATEQRNVYSLPSIAKPDLRTPAGSFSTLDELQSYDDALKVHRDWYVQTRVSPPQSPSKASYPEIPWYLQRCLVMN